jgi:RND family efflux transporter MFP subunit
MALGCEGEAPAKSGANGPPPARVWVGEVRSGSIEAQWSFLGDVSALQHARLAAGASGEVRVVRVRVGDYVKRGDLLVEVDPSLAAARVRAASASKQAGSAQLERAQRDAERLSVAGPDIAARAEIEQANSEHKRAGAERGRLKAAEAEARHRVTAPFDGVVATRRVDPGDWVDPGVEVIELIDDRDVEVLASVPPEVARFLSVGDKASFGRGGETAVATIRGIVPALDAESRTVRVRLVPGEPTAWLLPGAAVDVLLTVNRSEEGAVVVPRDALVYGIASLKVVKSVDGKAEPVPIEVVARGRDEVLIRAEGLAAGDVVVTRGNERLFPGQPLIVLED